MKTLDHNLSKSLNIFTSKSVALSGILSLITHSSSGKVYPAYVVLIPFILPNGTQIAKLGIVTFAFQVPLYFFIKNLFKRGRPSISSGFKQVINAPDRYSLPSGHSASALLFTLIVNKYTPELTPYFLVWMLAVWISRVGLGLHYISDVIAGILLGLVSYAIGNAILFFF